MNERRNILNKVILGADLPGEALPGQPLVEITGECRVLIENHKGVTVYGCNEIRVNVRFGSLSVCGSGLELVRMTKQQLVITGRIDGVSLHRGRR